MGGYLEVSIKGCSPERFFNLCSGHNILIWDLCRDGESYRFKITIRGFRCIRPFVRKTKTKVRILRRYGLPFWLHRHRLRKLYFAGFFLAGLLLLTVSQFVWNIEFLGNSKVTEESLMKFLNESHCGYGCVKKDVDCQALEAEIRENFPDVIWTSVQIQGTKMTVQIKESLLPAQTGEEKTASYSSSDLIAPGNGVVASIVTRNGTPYVRAGDEVKTGDILVSGRIDLLNDSGEITEVRYCNADADIYLTMEMPYQDEIKATYQRKVFTGNTNTRYALECFSRIFGPIRKQPSYPDCDITTEYRQCCLYQDFYLPFTLQITRYREYMTEPGFYTETELKAMAEERLQIYLDEISQKEVQILEKNVIMDMYEKKLKVSGSILLQTKVSDRQQTETVELTQESEGLDTDEFE